MKRKICFIITSHIHYSRSRKLLEALRDHKDVELQIAVAASAILPQYGDVLTAMEKDGFKSNAKIIMTLAGGSPVAMAKTTGIGLTEFATAFDNLQPDVIVVRGDRYEILAAAIAASYMNITVAHIEGGDITGTIDESVRHAVTKLAHVHLTTNDLSKKRVARMGENPAYIFNVGCPELEGIQENTVPISSEEINQHGVGHPLDLAQNFLTVMFHPVTTDRENFEHANMLLQTIHETGMQTIWFWPNVDAGTDDVAKAIRVFREKHDPKHMHFMKYLPAEKFMALLKETTCLVGNSSAGIKEGSYLGVPVVNIGNRQEGRLQASNVINTSFNKKEISKAIEQQVQRKKYEPSTIYYKANSAKTITDILATCELYVQKKFHENADA